VLFVHSSNGTATAKQLKRLGDQPKAGGTLAVRERWRPLPATWAKAHEYRAELEKQGALRWSWLEREEVVGLVALQSMWMAVRSHDVSGPDGKPIDEPTARAWLAAPERLGLDRLRAWLAGECEEAAPPPPPSAPAVTAARQSAGGPSTSPVWQVMQRLRVASLERVARELGGELRGCRAEVRAAVAASGGALELVGSSIVVCVEAE
jgi:hypothetical protein